VAALRRAAFLNPGRDLTTGIDLARRAEATGYDSVWVTHGSGRDSFLVLAAYGAATTRLGLGNGVVPIYPRHPVVMAQAALTLAEMTGGRFRLGIGVSHRSSMEAALGVPLREPLAVMREYVAVLRGAFGPGVDFNGRHYRVRWSMGVPERLPAPPIYLAALSVKMLELAGEIADGAVLWLTPPAYVRDVAVPALERGRRRAGKTLDGFETVVAVPLAITDDRPTAASTSSGARPTRGGMTDLRDECDPHRARRGAKAVVRPRAAEGAHSASDLHVSEPSTAPSTSRRARRERRAHGRVPLMVPGRHSHPARSP